MIAGQANLVPLIDRFFLDESRSWNGSPCWNWKGSKIGNGYGMARYKKKHILAHRLSAHFWLRMDIKDKRYVLHHCDNPGCFNPKHLFIGTQYDNMQDRKIKGRDPDIRGSKNPKWRGGVSSLQRSKWSPERLAHKRKLAREAQRRYRVRHAVGK